MSPPNTNPPLNPSEDWPYGFGMCCCGCGQKARVEDGVQQKFYRKYHERWLLAKMRRESPPKRQDVERNYYPSTSKQQPLSEDEKRTRPNKFAIAKHLPNAFQVSQSEVNQLYADKKHGSPTASEREKQFPQLNAPTVELRNRLKQASAAKSELDSSTAKQPGLFSGSDKPDRLNQQLAWIKKNQPLLEAISRSRDRVAVAVNGAYIRNREKVDVEFRLLQRIRGRISGALKGRAKSLSTLKLIGCALPEFKAHLKKQFKAGMSWSNYGQWHVDHIRPCASFDLNDPVSLSQCFHYTNLQPMWALDNAKKNSSWEGKLIRRKNQE